MPGLTIDQEDSQKAQLESSHQQEYVFTRAQATQELGIENKLHGYTLNLSQFKSTSVPDRVLGTICVPKSSSLPDGQRFANTREADLSIATQDLNWHTTSEQNLGIERQGQQSTSSGESFSQQQKLYISSAESPGVSQTAEGQNGELISQLLDEDTVSTAHQQREQTRDQGVEMELPGLYLGGSFSKKVSVFQNQAFDQTYGKSKTFVESRNEGSKFPASQGFLRKVQQQSISKVGSLRDERLSNDNRQLETVLPVILEEGRIVGPNNISEVVGIRVSQNQTSKLLSNDSKNHGEIRQESDKLQLQHDKCVRNSIEGVYYKQRTRSRLKGKNIGTGGCPNQNSEESQKKTRDLIAKQQSLESATSKRKNFKTRADRVEGSGSFNSNTMNIQKGILAQQTSQVNMQMRRNASTGFIGKGTQSILKPSTHVKDNIENNSKSQGLPLSLKKQSSVDKGKQAIMYSTENNLSSLECSYANLNPQIYPEILPDTKKSVIAQNIQIRKHQKSPTMHDQHSKNNALGTRDLKLARVQSDAGVLYKQRSYIKSQQAYHPQKVQLMSQSKWNMGADKVTLEEAFRQLKHTNSSFKDVTPGAKVVPESIVAQAYNNNSSLVTTIQQPLRLNFQGKFATEDSQVDLNNLPLNFCQAYFGTQPPFLTHTREFPQLGQVTLLLHLGLLPIPLLDLGLDRISLITRNVLYDCYIAKRLKSEYSAVAGRLMSRDSIGSIVLGTVRRHVKLVKLHNQYCWQNGQLLPSKTFTRLERTGCNLAAIMAQTNAIFPHRARLDLVQVCNSYLQELAVVCSIGMSMYTFATMQLLGIYPGNIQQQQQSQPSVPQEQTSQEVTRPKMRRASAMFDGTQAKVAKLVPFNSMPGDLEQAIREAKIPQRQDGKATKHSLSYLVYKMRQLQSDWLREIPLLQKDMQQYAQSQLGYEPYWLNPTVLPPLHIRRILLYGMVQGFSIDDSIHNPIWYGCIYSVGVMRGCYYMRVLGSWGMNISGQVDSFAMKMLANAAFESRDIDPKTAFESAMSKLKAENKGLKDQGKAPYSLVVYTLLYVVTGICGFLADGYRFPAPCLNHLFLNLSHQSLLQFIHCVGMAEMLCLIVQYFPTEKFEYELNLYLQSKALPQRLFNLADPLSKDDNLVLKYVHAARKQRSLMTYLQSKWEQEVPVDQISKPSRQFFDQVKRLVFKW